jgi:hypothetical protein
MPLLNYTSGVDADKTISEIQKILGSHGAEKVMTDYKDGIVFSLSFALTVNGKPMGFRLPCDWRPVYDILTKDRDFERYYDQDKNAKLMSDAKLQAVRTAWRIVKDWVEAQMALVDTAMVKTQDVFLPYLVMADNRTLAENVSDGKFLLENKK